MLTHLDIKKILTKNRKYRYMFYDMMKLCNDDTYQCNIFPELRECYICMTQDVINACGDIFSPEITSREELLLMSAKLSQIKKEQIVFPKQVKVPSKTYFQFLNDKYKTNFAISKNSISMALKRLDITLFCYEDNYYINIPMNRELMVQLITCYLFLE